MKKQCKKCLQIKEIENFYIHKEMLDGHLSFCKDCVKERVRYYYGIDIEKSRTMERKRSQERRKDKEYSKKKREYNHQWRTKEKIRAHNATRRRLRRPNLCESCGRECQPHGHHESYAEPLRVMWLCAPCHTHMTRYKSLPHNLNQNH